MNYQVKRCPLIEEMICGNAINDKCAFGITDVTKCPLLMWGIIIGKQFGFEDDDIFYDELGGSGK